MPAYENVVKNIILEMGLLEMDVDKNNDMWEEIARFVIPRKRDYFYNNLNNQGGKMGGVYDSTAIEANERLAASIGGVVTPATLDWFLLDLPVTTGKTHSKVVSNWLQSAGKVMLQELQRSNFDAEIQECYQDLCAFGTCSTWIEEETKNGNYEGLVFRALNLGEYMIGEDYFGRINKVFRKFPESLINIVERFGEDALGDDLTKRFHEKPSSSVEMVHAIYHRQGRKISPAVDRFDIVSVYFDRTSKHVFSIGGFNEWPIPVGRWNKTSGEVYGRGPGSTALPDIQTINEADRKGIQQWAKALEPPIIALHDGIIGRPTLKSGHINWVNTEGALTTFNTGQDINVDVIRRTDKRESIRRIFFMDQVQFLPERGKTPPTAAEVQARLNIMLQILGPTLSRLESEFLSPIIERVFQILLRSGMIPEPPQEVLAAAEKAGGNLDVQFVGPIARAKKQTEAASMDGFMGFVSGIASLDPSVLDNIDFDEVARVRANIENVPLNFLRTKDEVANRRADRAASNQVIDDQEADLNDSKVVSNLGEG
jgi:hypothetical protein